MFPKILLLCSFAILMIGNCAAVTSLCDDSNFFPIEKAYPGCVEKCWSSFQIAANAAKETLCNKIKYDAEEVAKSSKNLLGNIYNLGIVALNVSQVIGASCTDCKAIQYEVCDLAERVGCFNTVLASCDADKALANLQKCVKDSETKAAINIATLSKDCQNITNNAVTSGLASIEGYYTNPDLFQIDLPTVVRFNCCS